MSKVGKTMLGTASIASIVCGSYFMYKVFDEQAIANTYKQEEKITNEDKYITHMKEALGHLGTSSIFGITTLLGFSGYRKLKQKSLKNTYELNE